MSAGSSAPVEHSGAANPSSGFLPVLSCVSSLIAAELDDRGAIHLFAPLHGREGAHEFDMQCKYRCCVRVMNKVIIHVANDAT